MTPKQIEQFNIMLEALKHCYWEDMENLTNTPIEYVLKAMQEYSLLQRNEMLKIAESISFNTEDQAGNNCLVVDLEELKEKLKR